MPEFDEDVVIKGELRVLGPVRPTPAAQFGSHVGIDGNLDVLGNLQMLKGDIFLLNADCAEEFDVSVNYRPLVTPGVVVVLSTEGSVRQSTAAYDKRVAGVVSGAGNYKPAIVLDRKSGGSGRIPVALMGKVACCVDAKYGRVDVGDLLTTSDTPGHAMKVSDPSRAFGAVLGKALGSLQSGCALVPILVSLQ